MELILDFELHVFHFGYRWELNKTRVIRSSSVLLVIQISKQKHQSKLILYTSLIFKFCLGRDTVNEWCMMVIKKNNLWVRFVNYLFTYFDTYFLFCVGVSHVLPATKSQFLNWGNLCGHVHIHDEC